MFQEVKVLLTLFRANGQFGLGPMGMGLVPKG